MFSVRYVCSVPEMWKCYIFIYDQTLLIGKPCCKECLTMLGSTGLGLESCTGSQKAADALHIVSLGSTAAITCSDLAMALRCGAG